MNKLTYQQNERRKKARLIARLLAAWESIETGSWRDHDGYRTERWLAGEGLFDFGLGKLTPEGQRIVEEVLVVEINTGSRDNSAL